MIAVSEDGWGEARERAYRRRKRREAVLIMVAAVIVWALSPFIAAFVASTAGPVPGASQAVIKLVVTIGTISVAVVGAAVAFFGADEVERRLMVQTVAMFGLIMMFGAPIANAMSNTLQLHQAPAIVLKGATAMTVLFYVSRRFSGRWGAER